MNLKFGADIKQLKRDTLAAMIINKFEKAVNRNGSKILKYDLSSAENRQNEQSFESEDEMKMEDIQQDDS